MNTTTDPATSKAAGAAGTPSWFLARPGRGWPVERVLFAMAGTVVLLAVALSALVSSWFLLLAAFVGLNQWLYVLAGDCPASLILTRLFGLKRGLR
jgi:hypothetical protein